MVTCQWVLSVFTPKHESTAITYYAVLFPSPQICQGNTINGEKPTMKDVMELGLCLLKGGSWGEERSRCRHWVEELETAVRDNCSLN